MTLFTRSFVLIALLILASAAATVQLYRVYEREPRSRELAQQTISTVNLTRAALVSADPFLRRELLIELNETEGLRVFPATASEKLEPVPDEPLLNLVIRKVRAVTGARRMPSRSFSSMSRLRRRTGSAFTSAARVRLTMLTVCCASSRARGSRS